MSFEREVSADMADGESGTLSRANKAARTDPEASDENGGLSARLNTPSGGRALGVDLSEFADGDGACFPSAALSSCSSIPQGSMADAQMRLALPHIFFLSEFVPSRVCVCARVCACVCACVCVCADSIAHN